jgi:hypothetical protein
VRSRRGPAPSSCWGNPDGDHTYDQADPPPTLDGVTGAASKIAAGATHTLAIRTQCSDGLDDDGDGLADYPADPGCFSIQDDVEVDPAACGNGLDDDGDGRIDFPSDKGCTSASDTSEREASLPCDDGVDNDGDGLTDYVDLTGNGGISDPPAIRVSSRPCSRRSRRSARTA